MLGHAAVEQLLVEAPDAEPQLVGGPAPGMNNVVRAAVRLGLDRGYTVLAVKNGFLGLHDGQIREMGWMDVSGWVSEGGADIGTNRFLPAGPSIAQIARQIATHRIDGLLMAGRVVRLRSRSCAAQQSQEVSAP